MPLPCDHWRIQGAFRATPPEGPKWPVCPPLPQKNTVDRYEFCYSIWFFFYRYERCHKSLALPDRLFFSVFLSSKFLNCLRNSKIFLQLDAYASIIDSNPTEIHKNAHFSSTSKISTSVIFSMILGTSLAGGKSDISSFFRKWILGPPKK